jgi:NTP pyrophosphatase (non-canonical NTP hydrolase)
MQNLISYHTTNHPFKQIKKCVEELDELANELERFDKGDFEIEKLLDELFDVWIMIEQIFILFVGEDGESKALWFKIIDNKINREIIRWDLKDSTLY